MTINYQIIEDWTKSDDEILTWLNEPIRVKTGKKIRFNDIEEQFPDTQYRSLVINSVAHAGQNDPEAQVVFIAASGEGADLSDRSAQAKTRQIAETAEWPEELTDWVLSRCVTEGPRWQHLGIEEPALQLIAEARIARTVQIDAAERFKRISILRSKWDSNSGVMRALIESGQLDNDQVPAKLAEVWQR